MNAAARSTGADGRPLQGANYAIAAGRARPVLDILRRGRSMAWIGASFGYPRAGDVAARGLPPGLWIRGAVRGSGADRAGLADDGALLVAVNGRPMNGTLSGWCSATAGIASGVTARVELAAPGGDRRTVDVPFG